RVVRQQAVLLPHPFAFGIAVLRLDLNFPEHRAPSWLGPTVRSRSPSPYLPDNRGIGSAGPETDQAPPARENGSARKWRSTTPDLPRQRESYRETRWRLVLSGNRVNCPPRPLLPGGEDGWSMPLPDHAPVDP